MGQTKINITFSKRKLIIVIVIVAAIAMIIALLIPSWYNSQQHANVYKAEIVSFTADTGFYPIVGVTMILYFNVTVQNIGKGDINSANVTVQRITNGTDTLSEYVYLDENIVTLHSGEIRLIRVTLLTSLDHYGEVASSNFIASIKLNGAVLDERKLF
jgi:hypothetical protein